MRGQADGGSCAGVVRAVGLAVAGAMCSAACGADAPPGGAKGLRIYWVDVEGGGTTLIVTPAGESVLIDTGMDGQRDPNRTATLARKAAGLEQIDHLVVTHFDVDHHGGAAEIAKRVRAAFPAAEISYEPDPVRAKIVDSWPQDVDDSAARADWGFNPVYDAARAFDEYLVPRIRARYERS